jgi:DNA polymerase-3 subunit gamma/tau
MKALYREYRPDTFEEVIGQEATISALQRVLANGKIAHAYLFSGPRGCGKTTCARIFARCLNCAEGPTPTPCGKCASCVELRTGGPGSVDVIEMDAASHNGVDDARDLRERVEYAPSRDRYKIVILDEAHMITANAFNALLKIVEEPPEHVKFIFATTEPEKVIGTIRSRTYHYPFRLVSSSIMIDYIKQISSKENVELDERIYPLLAKIGGGSVRDTMSFLDQLFASAVEGKVDYDFAVQLLGFTPIEYISEALYALAGADIRKLFEIAAKLADNGVSAGNFLAELLENVRDSLLISISTHDVKSAFGEVDEQHIKALSTLAGAYGFATTSAIADALLDGVNKMRGPTSGRLVLELTFANLAAIFGNTPGNGTANANLQATQFAPGGDRAASATTPARNTTTLSAQSNTVSAGDRAALSAQANTAPGGNTATLSAQAAQTARPETARGEQNAGNGTANANLQTATAPASVNASENSGQNANAGVQGAVSDELVVEKWQQILEALSTIKKPAAILIKAQGKFLRIEGNALLIAFENPRFVDTFERSQYASFTSRAASQILGSSIAVRAVSGAGNSSASASAQISQAPPTPQSKSNTPAQTRQKPQANAGDEKSAQNTAKSAKTTGGVRAQVQTQEAQDSQAQTIDEPADDDEVISENASTANDPFSSLKDVLGATEVQDV